MLLCSKLLIASVVMLLGGYFNETNIFGVAGFIVGTIAWVYIIYEVFFGEASQINADVTKPSNLAIVTVGWSIYPVGYIVGYAGGSTDAGAEPNPCRFHQ